MATVVLGSKKRTQTRTWAAYQPPILGGASSRRGGPTERAARGGGALHNTNLVFDLQNKSLKMGSVTATLWGARRESRGTMQNANLVYELQLDNAPCTTRTSSLNTNQTSQNPRG